MEAQVYKYLFRFFKYAPRFVPSSNMLVATGQFIKKSGETLLMLPPFQNSNGKENQTPVLSISPSRAAPGQYVLTPEHNSPARFSIDGNPLTPGTTLSLDQSVELMCELGHEDDSDYEKVTFNLFPLSALSAGRQRVAEKKGAEKYVGFAEVSSKRNILLSRREIKIGRGGLLHKDTPISGDALTLKRKYVVWEALAKREDNVLYYSRAQGQVAQEVTQIVGTIGLGLMGTYFMYVDDYEFTLSLESTRRTELHMIQVREQQGID
jgi:hypothetical protein